MAATGPHAASWLAAGLVAVALFTGERAVAAPAAKPAATKPAAKPAAKPSKAPPTTATSVPGDDDPDPPVNRTVIHTEAYKERKDVGPHVNIKITPPEKVGRKHRVLVEVYNYSKVYLNVMDFYLQLYSDWGDRVEVHITVDDIKPRWSALKWVRIQGNKEIPKITKVEVQKMQIFNDKGKKTNVKFYTDLIKE